MLDVPLSHPSEGEFQNFTVMNLPTTLHVIPTMRIAPGLTGTCFLLEDGNNSVMIDTGLYSGCRKVEHLLRKIGLPSQSIKAILLTHGHLDHAGNLAPLKSWTGATIHAHPAEQAHIDGAYPYKGINRWCGWLEAAGRFIFRYRPAKIDEFLTDSQELPFWGGLRVIHLPGHTAGHCGFYSAKHDLLFCGDMFAETFLRTHRPAAILNSIPQHFAASAHKIQQLRPRFILPNHCGRRDGEANRRAFARLYGLTDWY